MFKNFRPKKKKNPHEKQNTNTKTLSDTCGVYYHEEDGVQWQPCGLIFATSAISDAGQSVWIVREVGCRRHPGSA